MKSIPENRLTFGIPGDSVRRDPLPGESRKRIHLDVSPLRLWQILAVECILTLLLLMLIMPIVRGDNPMFSLTADFDNGTKTDTETISDVCHLQTSANRLSLAGAGDYVGINSGCIAGTKDIATTNLLSSYDFQTLRSSKLKDFKGTDDCTLVNAPTSVAAIYGNGYTLVAASTQRFDCTAETQPTPDHWTIHVLTKPTANGGIIVSMDSIGNLFLDYGFILAGSFTCADGGQTTSGVASINNFHYVDCVKNTANSTLNIYVDGVWKSKANSPGITTWDSLIWGDFKAGGGLKYSGVLDEALIWNTALTGTQITSLSTNGLSQYAASGTWKSVLQAGLSTSWTITGINVTWTPAASSNRKLSGAAILNSGGGYLFADGTQISSGTSKAYTISPGVASTGHWKVQVNLTGNAADTINILTITITIHAPGLTFNGVVDPLIIFTFIGLLTLAVLGAVSLRRRFA